MNIILYRWCTNREISRQGRLEYLDNGLYTKHDFILQQHQAVVEPMACWQLLGRVPPMVPLMLSSKLAVLQVELSIPKFW